MENYNSPKILIVDDEKGLRTGTKRLLEEEGYIVDTTGSGKEGIALGTQNDYDLSIIDLKMPDVDGITVLKEILKVKPNTICIVATGYASYETAIEATKLGAFSYIPKPFTPEEILKKLNEGYYRRQILLEQERWKKEREERLLEVAFEKTRLNTIINSMTEGLLVVNKNGEAVLFNPSALKFLRLNSIRIEEHIVSRLHPKIAMLINKLLLANSFQNKSYSTQLEIDSNQKLFIEVTTSPVPHPDGSLAGVVMLIKDITEIKKIEMLKSQFVSMVSHELKAPIAAVSGYLKLLSNNSIALTDEQKKNYIIRSLVRLESLLKMVNDLLDISRMEINTAEREIKKLNLYEIVKNQIELFQFQLKEKNLTVKFETKNNLLTFNADQGDMERLFTNIISNAIKYNKINGSIEIIMESTKEYLNVTIKDTGIGIKPEEKEKLFQEFFRAKNEKTKNISGTGLGLSIVKRIVDSYAGSIDVYSEFGKGTSVKVSFPLRQ